MIELQLEPIESLPEQKAVRSSFLVRVVYDVTSVQGGLGGLVLTERVLGEPYEKDYDNTRGGDPETWSKEFDVSRWAFFSARRSGERVGGAVVAFNTAGVHMLEGRSDLAVLWDLRVRADCRGQGVGATLFRAAEAWALAQGCSLLKVETQNVNVPACRFYSAQGCVLGAIHQFAYPDLPEEAMLLWSKPLRAQRETGHSEAGEGERLLATDGASPRR